MHPIEHLRYVARASGEDVGILAAEVAQALAAVARAEPVGLVPACRRLVEHHVAAGPVWWVATRVLSAEDPTAEARRAAVELEDDPTAREVERALPDGATVVVVGWPEIASAALSRRGDLEVLVVDSGGVGSAFARRLAGHDTDALAVPDRGAASAAVNADLVVVEALAGGPSGVLAAPGSHAVAAVAAHAGVPTWAVAGTGRVLPPALWEALLARSDGGAAEPWERPAELVPVRLLCSVVGPDGPAEPAEVLAGSAVPVAPALLRLAG